MKILNKQQIDIGLQMQKAMLSPGLIVTGVVYLHSSGDTQTLWTGPNSFPPPVIDADGRVMEALILVKRESTEAAIRSTDAAFRNYVLEMVREINNKGFERFFKNLGVGLKEQHLVS